MHCFRSFILGHQPQGRLILNRWYVIPQMPPNVVLIGFQVENASRSIKSPGLITVFTSIGACIGMNLGGSISRMVADRICHFWVGDDPRLHELNEKAANRFRGVDTDKNWRAFQWSVHQMRGNISAPWNWWHYYTISHDEMETEREKYFQEGLQLYMAEMKKKKRAMIK